MKKFNTKVLTALFKNKIFIIGIGILLVFFAVQYLLFTSGIIKPSIYSISIKTKATTINKNETTKIIANVVCMPFYAENNIIYVSGNSNIATVSSDGMVKGISEGNTKIIAKLNGMVAETNVNVTSKTLIPFAQGKYLGDIANLKRDGNGIMYYENGNIYDGFWKNDVIYGYGVMTWKDKNKYDGTWKNEQFDGYGKLERIGEYTYTGGWSNGQFNGYGEIIWKNGNSYNGYWLNGQLDGYGTFVWNHMDEYNGEWKNGNRNGYGQYVYNRNNNKYLGNWKDNFRDGYGVEYHNNTIYYQGFWKNDMLNGYGKLYSGGVLDTVGEFADDKPY